MPKKVPTALTLLAREVRKGLPDVVLRVPDVRAAIERGALRVVAQEADPLPAPAAVPLPVRTRPARTRREE